MSLSPNPPKSAPGNQHVTDPFGKKKTQQHWQSPFRAAQLIYFFGYTNPPGQKAKLKHRFQALTGSQPPTITGGWGNIATVTRPRSLDYTVVTDYPVWTMDVQIRFENWAAPINPDVENDLQKLTWMYNRGKLAKHLASGNPPIVRLSTSDGGKTQLPVIPPDVWGVDWVISNVQYDTAPIRFDADTLSARGLKNKLPVGSRARQDVIVSLTQWNPAPGFDTKAVRPSKAVIYENATVKAKSIRAMCQIYFGKDQHSDYLRVVRLPANKHLHIRNPAKILKPGTRVAFPADFQEVN